MIRCTNGLFAAHFPWIMAFAQSPVAAGEVDWPPNAIAIKRTPVSMLFSLYRSFQN
jgi:hypothetical protein